jgi:hypothetical protein
LRSAPRRPRPYSPESGAAPQAVLLEHSGETFFSKWKRRFHFEEEEQRNE